MPANEAKRKYDIQYAKEKLKRIPLDVKKEKYEEIKAAANVAGEPVNGYIKKAIAERMERDNKALSSTAALPDSEPDAKPITSTNETLGSKLNRLRMEHLPQKPANAAK